MIGLGLGLLAGAQAFTDAWAGIAADVTAQGNARRADLDAEAARAATDDALRIARAERDRVLGQTRANAAASGLALVGSPLEVLAANARAADADLAAIARTGANRVRAFRLEAAGFRQQGRMTRTAGVLDAGTSLLAFGLGRLPAATPPAGRFGLYGDDFHVRGPGGGRGPV